MLSYSFGWEEKLPWEYRLEFYAEWSYEKLTWDEPSHLPPYAMCSDGGTTVFSITISHSALMTISRQFPITNIPFDFWGDFFLSRSRIRAGVNPAIELNGFVSLGGIVFIAPGRNIATAHWLVVMPGWQDKGWCLDVLSQPWPRSDLCAAYLAGLYRGPTRWGPFALCISNTSSYAPLLWGSGWINSKMLFWPGSGSSFKTACIINFALIF